MNFEDDLWKPYPAKSQHKGPKAKAEKLWNKLDMYQKHEVIRSLPVYEAHLQENPWKQPAMVRTYIGPQRYWEGFQPAEANEAEIQRIEERKKRHREERAKHDAYAHQQWIERYKRQFGHEPKGV